MIRERGLKVVLVIAGLLFVALLYPGVMFFRRDPGVAMIMSLYVTLGIFLLMAVRNPAGHRSLITYAGWANVAHASVMGGAGIHARYRVQGVDGSGRVRNHRDRTYRFGACEAAGRASSLHNLYMVLQELWENFVMSLEIRFCRLSCMVRKAARSFG